MSMKRIMPILLLFGLVIGLAACQPDTAKEAVGGATVQSCSETERATNAENCALGDAESDNTVARDTAAPSDDAARDEAVDQKAAVPEFVPPKPATLDTETVAYAMGDADAPVQIVEFTDYECPYCQRYAQETMPALVENLVDSGRVFYAIKDLPLDAIHPEARSASVAARCAGEQDAYLPMHDAIFASQADWRGSGDRAGAIFADLAADLDLDAGAFSTCMADGHQADGVQENVEEAMALGVSGTPVFFIDGYGVSGAQPYELFETAVELAENGELDDVIEAQARQTYEAMLAQQAAAQRAAALPAAPVEVPLEDAYSIGDPNAPVTIVEYTDYQCPFCARHALETYAQIEESLVDTGKVRYVFKDLPLTSIHPQATLAAEAARCAGDQDMGQERYVAMHSVLFEKQKAWSGQAGAADLFADYAAEMGLDREVFATCLKNHDFEDAVQADMQEAMDLGINGAPAFLINGHLVSGALPFDVFDQAVEGLIAEATDQPASN